MYLDHPADIREAQYLIENSMRHSSRQAVANTLGWSVYRVDRIRSGLVTSWQLNVLREMLSREPSVSATI